MSVTEAPRVEPDGDTRPLDRVDGDLTHETQVDHHPVITDRMAGDVMAAAADRNGQPGGDRELDRSGDVTGIQRRRTLAQATLGGPASVSASGCGW